MKRIDLQKIAQAKLDDAILLLRNERFSNAYYLAGYSIELALKACISRQISTDTIPDKNLVNRLYSHNFRDLVGLAGLTKELKQEEALNTNFSMNWALINEWSPDARYTSIDRMSTQYLIEAIKSDDDGVFTWIKKHW